MLCENMKLAWSSCQALMEVMECLEPVSVFVCGNSLLEFNSCVKQTFIAGKTTIKLFYVTWVQIVVQPCAMQRKAFYVDIEGSQNFGAKLVHAFQMGEK